MSDSTLIEWSDATWQPITGCSVISPACRSCYAMRLAGGRLRHHPSRMGLTVETPSGPVWNGQVRLNEQWLSQPIQWRRRRMIFVCAHGDLFHPKVPYAWIDSVFGVMWACLYGMNGEAGHIFQVLTKRSDRMRQYFSQDRREQWARAAVHYGGGGDPDGLWDQIMAFEGPHPRIWLGVSVEDQKRADERIPDLLATPAAVRWISAEPLLGPVDLRHLNKDQANEVDALLSVTGRGAPETWEDDFEAWHDSATGNAAGLCRPGIDWVVAGAESGPRARPMDLEWARYLCAQCRDTGVRFLMKQISGEAGRPVKDIALFPEDLRVRDYPGSREGR